jgi:hypothetical protein
MAGGVAGQIDQQVDAIGQDALRRADPFAGRTDPDGRGAK